MIEKKHKSMICRMAGNIAVGVIIAETPTEDATAVTPSAAKAIAVESLMVAIAIYENADEIMESSVDETVESSNGMKTWRVVYSHRTETDNKRQYDVVAEDDVIAAVVGTENLENDEKNWDADPHHWIVESVSRIEGCQGCGGTRFLRAPVGQGRVLDL